MVILDISSYGLVEPIDTNDVSPDISTVLADKRNCYSYNITEEMSNENIITLISLFNGQADLQINSLSFAPFDDSSWKTYPLSRDNTIKLTPKDLWSFL